ncbi:MAG: DUF86 domain-containing protein [Nitrospira sp.]|nr:DUF86 domain-containing protein [Nitrospira sp.]
MAILSEAAVKLGDDAQKFAPDIPWPSIRGIGNHIRHSYDVVNLDTIWAVVPNDLPPLKKACLETLTQLNLDHGSTPSNRKSSPL